MESRLNFLKNAFTKLEQVDRREMLCVPDSADLWQYMSAVLFHEKLYLSFACTVYPEIKSQMSEMAGDFVTMPNFCNPVYRGYDLGCFEEGLDNYGSREYDDLMDIYCGILDGISLLPRSPLFVAASHYYLTSSTWDILVFDASFNEYYDISDAEKLEEMVDGGVVKELGEAPKMIQCLDLVFGDFMDEGAKRYYETFFDNSHPLSFLDRYGEGGPAVVCLKSYLLPYYKRIEERAKREEPELVGLMDRCIDVLLSLCTAEVSNPELCLISQECEASYFFQSDYCSMDALYDNGGNFTNCIDLGMCALKFRYVFAGELIDEIIYALDRKYQFLPEKFRR